jgi:hypothetical protein
LEEPGGNRVNGNIPELLNTTSIVVIRRVPNSNNDPTSSMQFQASISKQYVRLGGMAQSQWTPSVRAVRDTPVADYSAPGLNTRRRVTYRPPIAVSPFLHGLSVSYFKRTLWRCGEL